MIEQEIKIKKVWKIFGYIFCVIVVTITFYFFIDILLHGKKVFFWATINLVSILLFCYWFAAIHRAKLVLNDDSITEYRVFGKRRLFFSEVKGYRIQGLRIILVPTDNKRSRIVVGDLNYTKNGSGLATFLTNKFKDLNEMEYKIEVSEAFNNPAIGESVVEREQQIKKAKKVVRVFNIGGFIMMIFLLVPTSYNYHLPIVILGLLYPLGVLIYFFSKQQIVNLLDSGKQRIHPNLMGALFLPVAGLGLLLLRQYVPLHFADCILPTALLATVLLLSFILFLKKSKNRKSNLLMGVFFCIVYSASTIGIVNCAFDYSIPGKFRVKVLEHWILQNPTSYNVKLDAWALGKKPAVETVSRTTYDQIKNGDPVIICVKKGYLNIPWYFVE